MRRTTLATSCRFFRRQDTSIARRCDTKTHVVASPIREVHDRAAVCRRDGGPVARQAARLDACWQHRKMPARLGPQYRRARLSRQDKIGAHRSGPASRRPQKTRKEPGDFHAHKIAGRLNDCGEGTVRLRLRLTPAPPAGIEQRHETQSRQRDRTRFGNDWGAGIDSVEGGSHYV